MIHRLAKLSRRLLVRVLAGAPLGFATASSQDGVHHLTRKQLREMMRNARTPEDHRRLSIHFRVQERLFREMEGAQLMALQEYYADHKASPGKCPTRGDTARHLANQFARQGQLAADRASEQERLARRRLPAHKSMKTSPSYQIESR